MKIIAITTAGAEYMYSVWSAHAVPVSSAEKICAALNKAGYRIRDGKTWRLYDVGPLDNAYDIAKQQRFSVRSGRVYDNEMYSY